MHPESGAFYIICGRSERGLKTRQDGGMVIRNLKKLLTDVRG